MSNLRDITGMIFGDWKQKGRTCHSHPPGHEQSKMSDLYSSPPSWYKDHVFHLVMT